jgi:Mlc titration factor MtfA (ptsG expression regulator)
MFFSWLKRRQRRRLLEQPFPPEWLGYLEANVALYRRLSPEEQGRLRDDLRVFAAEKNWEGCGGQPMTDEVKVTVAAQACLPLLNLEGHDYFARVLSILVYPHEFFDRERPDPVGLVEEEVDLLGEAHYRGPVVLSWEDVLFEGRHPEYGRNVVLHEFAHQLDMLDGLVDGTPPLASEPQRRRWREVMTREFDRLLKAADRGRRTLLDPYGATNEGEFFAVATECFFTEPDALQGRHPELYELLRDYYRQDPARRLTGPPG